VPVHTEGEDKKGEKKKKQTKKPTSNKSFLFPKEAVVFLGMLATYGLLRFS